MKPIDRVPVCRGNFYRKKCSRGVLRHRAPVCV